MIKLPEQLENKSIESRAQKRNTDFYFAICPLCGIGVYGLNHAQVNLRAREHAKRCKGDINKHRN